MTREDWISRYRRAWIARYPALGGAGKLTADDLARAYQNLSERFPDDPEAAMQERLDLWDT